MTATMKEGKIGVEHLTSYIDAPPSDPEAHLFYFYFLTTLRAAPANTNIYAIKLTPVLSDQQTFNLDLSYITSIITNGLLV